MICILMPMFEEIAGKIQGYIEKRDPRLWDCKICMIIEHFTKKQCIINAKICMPVLIYLFNIYLTKKKRIM